MSALEELVDLTFALNTLAHAGEAVMQDQVEYEKTHGLIDVQSTADKMAASAWTIAAAQVAAITAIGKAVGFLLAEEAKRDS